ncbi:MAG: ribokinase [Bacillota bacterium]
MKKLCVIGSLNMDLVAVAERFPRPGETLVGSDFGAYPGGKGANQAVALGRLGADVRMTGKVGDDPYGRQYLQILKENGVQASGVGFESGIFTGTAVIEVDKTGENHIIVVPGANGRVDRSFIRNKLEYMLECDIFLLQLEIPMETTMFIVDVLRERSKVIIMDPAPARPLSDETIRKLDFITPNETELAVLTDCMIDTEDALVEAGNSLLARGAGAVIIKAGKKGAYLITPRESVHVPGFTVNAVDTTAAGDSFNAGFAFALARGMPLKECVRFGNGVGALSTTAKGAQGAMPGLEEVESFLADFVSGGV